MTLPITTLLAGIMGLLFVVLSVRVIQARQSTSVALGDGGDKLLTRRMRGHANFCEYAPIGIVLLGLLEYQQSNPLLLIGCALLLAIARIFHGITFAFSDHFAFGRVFGAGGSLVAIGVMAIAAIATAITG